MAASELFYGPHPSGVGLVAREAATASAGPSSGGRVIGANEQGDLDDSWLPFSRAGELAETEIDSAGIPVQASDGSGRVWRWFGLQRFADWIEARVLDAVAPVGTVRVAVQGANQKHWMRLDGRTIGDSTSNADVADVGCEALFKVLWNGIGGAYALQLRNRDGLEVARGASAAADWTAGRRLSLPNPAGRVLMAAGNGDGLSARTSGMTGGAEQVSVTEDHLTEHRHAVATATATDTKMLDLVMGGRVAATITNQATSTAAAEAVTSITSATVSEHSHGATVAVAGVSTAAHQHDYTTGAAGGGQHSHGADGSFETDPQKTVNVAVSEELDAGNKHLHAASFETDPAKTVSVPVTVQPATEAAHAHSGTTGQNGGSSHTHAADVTVASGGAGTHTHTAKTAVDVSVTTKVISTPVVSLQLDTVKRTVGGVGTALVDTSLTGRGAPLSILPPFMAFDLMIRY